MAAPQVAIGRLATRVTLPAPELAFAARRLLDEAVPRLGPALDRALAAAGFDDAAVLALPKLRIRLDLQGEVSAAELAEAWGQAAARAILAALPRAQAGDYGAAWRDGWGAEAAILRAVLADETAPWWTAEFGLDPARPLLAQVLARWVARDAAGAAWRMAGLLEAGVPARWLPEAAQSEALARALMVALGARLALLGEAAARRGAEGGAAAVAPATTPPEDAARVPAADAALLAALPASLRAALADMPPDRRAPWLIAAVLRQAPRFAPLLPALLARLAAMPAAAIRAAHPRDTAAVPAEDAAAEVWCGGLLLLIRPLASLHPGWLELGNALPPRLLTLGLLALRRIAAPLPPAARRAALERDRPLLALFAGVAPPEGPLEEAPLPFAAEAEDALARILAALPDGVAHAPGALRRAYGRDPFAADRATGLLCRLLLRPGRLHLEEEAARLDWPADFADLALRKAGWDLDPGWVPWLGRRIAFRYGAP